MTAVPASAQINRVILKGNIPFDFTYASRQLPADVYSFEIGPGGVCLIDARGERILIARANPPEYLAREETPRLVFRQYGRSNFLAEVWTVGQKIEFPVTPAERELRASLSRPLQAVKTPVH